MGNRSQLIIGGVLILFGVMALFNTVFGIDAWAIFWPSILIIIGIWIIVRPRYLGSGVELEQAFFGTIRRDSTWQVSDLETWIGIGDIKLNLSQASFPSGDTEIQVYGFIGDVLLKIPADVGVSVSTTAFISDVTTPEQKMDRIISPLHMESSNFQDAEKRVLLEVTAFIANAKVRYE
jgi:predicted membrane protein